MVPPFISFKTRDLGMLRHRQSNVDKIFQEYSNAVPIILVKGDDPQAIRSAMETEMTGVICNRSHTVSDLLSYATMKFAEEYPSGVNLLINNTKPPLATSLWDLYRLHHDEDLFLYVNVCDTARSSCYIF